METPQWHVDPLGRHEMRYWDGSDWTDNVSDNGVIGTDPVAQDAIGPGDEMLAIEASTPALRVVQQLKDLAELRDAGVLTEGEFETQKAKILDAP